MEVVKHFIENVLEKIKDKDSFTHGLSWTFSATSLGFLLQLIFSPVLSRIYGPQAYGEFAIYNVIVTNLSIFSTLAYPQALLTKSRKEDYFSISLFILFSTLIVIVLSSLIFFPFQSFWCGLFPNFKYLKWFPVLLIAVLVYSINEIFSKWNIKRKQFNRNAKFGLTGQLFSKIYAIIFGLKISDSGIGIISSEILRAIWNSLFLLSFKQKQAITHQLLKLNKNKVFKSIIEAKADINYPLFVWPGNWLNMFSNQLPILFFTGFYSLENVGAFTFATSLIAIPSRLIGNAIRPVYFQKCQELYENKNIRTLKKFTQKVSLYLFIISLPLFILIIFLGPNIFQFVFGDNWIVSGKIASYMAITQLSSFSVSPVSSLFLSLKKEKMLLFFQIFLFSIRVLTLGFGIYIELDFLNVVLFYSLSNFIAYAVLHFLVFKLIK